MNVTHGNDGGAGIRVRGLVREFKGGIRAVDGIDLDVARGEIYGFLGPNGAGKSTTVLMLTTLLPPTAGEASVGGFDVLRNPSQVRQHIGAALQEVALDANLTGWEHVRLQAALQGVPKSTRVERGRALLERVGLSEAADRSVGGYSGGMKRRLDLALALVHSPEFLFLDEPTTGLDPQSRAALWDEVRRLAREDGVTIFLTTQYLEEADALADRVGIIHKGSIVAEGTPKELKADIGGATVTITPQHAKDMKKLCGVLERFGHLQDPADGEVTVVLDQGDIDLAAIVRAIDRKKIKVEDVSLHKPTLDDVFLTKTGRHLEGAHDMPEAQ